jgi:hypothetical protein
MISEETVRAAHGGTQIASKRNRPANGPSLAAADRSSTRPSARERGGRFPGLRLPPPAAGPKALSRDRRKKLAPTLSRTVFTVFCFYGRTNANIGTRAIFLCMKDTAPTIDAHVIHKTIHTGRRLH